MSRDDAPIARVPRPAPVPAIDERRDDDLSMHPDRLTPRELAEVRRIIADIDAGREKLIPWDEAAERRMFEEDYDSPSTPAQLADLDPQELAHLHQVVADIDAGREQLIPWEDAQKQIFAPFTPEELSEAAAMHRVRARR